MSRPHLRDTGFPGPPESGLCFKRVPEVVLVFPHVGEPVFKDRCGVSLLRDAPQRPPVPPVSSMCLR